MKIKSLNILYLAIYIICIKLITNVDGSPTGKVEVSFNAYLSIFFTLLFIICIFLSNVRYAVKFDNHPAILLPTAYYVYALLASFFSIYAEMSFYRSFIGICFCLIGFYIGKAAFQKKDQAFFENASFLILFFGVFGVLVFNIMHKDIKDLMYLQGGFIALIAAYISLSYLINYYESKRDFNLFYFLFFFGVCVFLNSFSSFLALNACIFLVLYFYKRRFLLVFFLVLFFIFLYFFFSYVASNPDQLVLGKPAGAYLTGSGRFAIYQGAIEVYSSLPLFQKIFGVGFMAEREVLSQLDLTWNIDVHNSFLSTLLGLGILGGFIYLLCMLAPFFYLKRLKKNINHVLLFKWIVFHSLCFIYGITSSTYIAVPSVIFIIYIAFTKFILSCYYECPRKHI